MDATPRRHPDTADAEATARQVLDLWNAGSELVRVTVNHEKAAEALPRIADTLEQFGIDVSYHGRHKFDPATFTALLKILRKKQADVVHLHGYGATTFGRLCAWRMGIPAILHEHANHTDTPWFQKVADRALAVVRGTGQ